MQLRNSTDKIKIKDRTSLDKRLFILIVTSLSACAIQPQTREDFISEHNSQSLLVNHETYTSSKLDYDDSLNNIILRFNECFKLSTITPPTEQVGFVDADYNDTYNVTVNQVSPEHTEINIQHQTSKFLFKKYPPEGEYIMALDVDKTAEGKAKLTWYSQYGWSKNWLATKRWSNGIESGCSA